MTNHAQTYTACCCQASLTDQLKKWRVQKEKPWLTWHNIPIFLYIWDVAWARAPNRTQNKQCTIWGGVNLIPGPWGNFQGRAEALVTSGAINDKNPQNFWADLSLERLEHKHCSGAEEQGKKNKQCTCTGCTTQCPVWRPCAWGSKFHHCEQQF